MGTVTCIAGIDTNIGKTVSTGLLVRTLLTAGYSVVTQKVAQTGCTGIAEDIQEHRKLMGTGLYPADKKGTTCPYVFPKPCSPHLAAELAQTQIDTETITQATKSLVAEFDHVLLEGVGGLMVPLTRSSTFLDYLQIQGYPLILVSSSRLGSINHTLSALELARGRGVEVKGIVYNCHEYTDVEILNDSRNVFASSLEKYGFSPVIVDMYSAESYLKPDKPFDCLQLFNIE